MPYIDRIQQLRAAEVYVLMIILLEWPKTKTCQQHVQYYKVHGHRHSVTRHCPCPNDDVSAACPVLQSPWSQAQCQKTLPLPQRQRGTGKDDMGRTLVLIDGERKKKRQVLIL